MVDLIDGLLFLPGIIVGILVAAFTLDLLGVQESFILVATSIVVGGPLGWFVERQIVRAWKSRAKR